jgi:hypothetical protein
LQAVVERARGWGGGGTCTDDWLRPKLPPPAVMHGELNGEGSAGRFKHLLAVGGGFDEQQLLLVLLHLGCVTRGGVRCSCQCNLAFPLVHASDSRQRLHARGNLRRRVRSRHMHHHRGSTFDDTSRRARACATPPAAGTETTPITNSAAAAEAMCCCRGKKGGKRMKREGSRWRCGAAASKAAVVRMMRKSGLRRDASCMRLQGVGVSWGMGGSVGAL